MPLKTNNDFEVEETLARAKKELKVSRLVEEYKKDNPGIPDWIINRLSQLLMEEDELDFDIALNRAHQEHQDK